MNPEEYIQRFSEELRGLPPDEKSDLVEEIVSHFSEGETDPKLGVARPERQERLSGEMGNPNELGRQLKRVHRSRAWMEYLLIVLPEFLISFVIGLVMLLLYPGNSSYTPAMNYFSARLVIWIYVFLAAIGYWIYKRHGQPTAFLYLLSTVCLRIIRLYIMNQISNEAVEFRNIPYSTLDAIFWSLVLIGAVIVIVKTLRQVRDPLWTTLMAIAVTTLIEGVVTSQVVISGNYTGIYPYPDSMFGWLILPRIGLILWPAIFLYAKKRTYRWVALLISEITGVIVNMMVAWQYPLLVIVRMLPVVVILAFWIYELVEKKRNLQMT
jgi:hypothetical protein